MSAFYFLIKLPDHVSLMQDVALRWNLKINT